MHFSTLTGIQASCGCLPKYNIFEKSNHVQTNLYPFSIWELFKGG